MRTKLALLTVLCMTSCEDACWLADYTFVREGEYVTVYGYDVDESDACGGSFDGVELHTSRIREFLGIDSNARYFYLWMSAEFFDGLCPEGATGCAPENTVLTPDLPDPHELTHVIAHEEWGRTASFLEEGLAKYMEPARAWDIEVEREWVQPERMSRLLTKPRLTTWNDYARAGHFVSFLVESHGVEAFTQLYARIPRESRLHDWEREVAEVYATTLDQLLLDYADYPLCSVQQYRAKLWGCDGEPDHVFTPETPEFEVVAGCSDPRAMNWVMQGVFITRQVQITQPTRIRTHVEIDGERVLGYAFMAHECAPCSADPLIIREATEGWVDIEPGTYVILLTLDPALGSTISLTMTAEG